MLAAGSGESYGIKTKIFDVICHMIIIGSRLAEAARSRILSLILYYYN